MFHVFVAAIQ